MPRRKVGFLELEVWEVWGLEGVEERMKTPTPTRTWGGILLGFLLVLLFFVALRAWLFVCLLLERVVVVVVIFQLYLGVTGRVANVGLIVVASGSVAE